MTRKVVVAKKRKRIFSVIRIFFFIIVFDFLVNILVLIHPIRWVQDHYFACQPANETSVRSLVRDISEVKEFEQLTVESGGSFSMNVSSQGNTWTADIYKQTNTDKSKFNTYIVDHCGVIRCSEKMYFNGKFIRNAQPNEYPCTNLYDTSQKDK